MLGCFNETTSSSSGRSGPVGTGLGGTEPVLALGQLWLSAFAAVPLREEEHHRGRGAQEEEAEAGAEGHLPLLQPRATAAPPGRGPGGGEGHRAVSGPGRGGSGLSLLRGPVRHSRSPGEDRGSGGGGFM